METLKSLFKPTTLKCDLFTIPKNVSRIGKGRQFWNLFGTIMTLTFSYLLTYSNYLIEQKLILNGIIIFMLYKSQYALRSGIRIKTDTEEQKLSLILNDELALRCAGLMSKVSNKIFIKDKDTHTFRIMKNEEVLNTCKIFISSLWKHNISFPFKTLECIFAIIMLISAILTNTSIPQVVFIPIIILFSLVSIIFTIYLKQKRKIYLSVMHKTDNEQDIIINDLLRVSNITKNDLPMRINKFKNSVMKSNENIHKFYRISGISNFVISLIELAFQYLIIIFYIINIDFNSITLATIAEITAKLAIVQTALGYIRDITMSIDKSFQTVNEIASVEENMKLILENYYSNNENTTAIDAINLKPFTIKYLEESENDKPFTLISENDIDISKGDVIILSGASGSGKSTFIKLLTDRISLTGTDIPKTQKCLFYDETLRFGSQSLYEELFCSDSGENLIKMRSILINLHLWQEIENNSIDVWQWLREKTFQALSNGQKQRIILAKILYWLDEEIDILALDEVTSGLDEMSLNPLDITANSVLKYCIEFANADKSRIIIISTHQDLSTLKSILKGQFNFKELQFKRKDDKNYII